MFADDSTLYTSGHNVDEKQCSLQTNLNAVTTWCEDNRMVIKTAKTKCMLITTKQRRHYLRNNQLAITLNDQQLQQVKQHKVIGVDVDENLQWREHVTGVFKKVSQTLALFRRIKHFLPKWSNIMFYNAHIMPPLDYCVTVWGDCSELNNLVKLQNQAARIVLDCHYLTPSKDMVCKIKWLPMKDWVKYRKATMTFKANNSNAPDYISSMFKPVGEVHSRTTRQTCKNDLYLPPRAKVNVFGNTLRYSDAQIWNDLPANVKHVPSVQMFKSNYLKLYFSSKLLHVNKCATSFYYYLP